MISQRSIFIMKTTTIILTFALMCGVLHAEFRTWTRNDGNTAELELVNKKGSGDSLQATFMMRNGGKVDFPVADLIEADAELVRKWEPTTAGGSNVFDEYLDGNLVKLEGKSLDSYEMEKKPTKYYLFYYTASWCGPCQTFTPSLVKFYDTHKPESDEFEIILITSDSDQKAMEKYAIGKKMNWPHLKFSKVRSFKKKFKHPGSGIPNLVLTDLNGKLIKTSYEGKNYVGPTVVMNHLKELIAE